MAASTAPEKTASAERSRITQQRRHYLRRSVSPYRHLRCALVTEGVPGQWAESWRQVTSIG
jgi:hypothetical protein